MAEEKKKRGRPRKKPSALLPEPVQEIVEKVIKEEKKIRYEYLCKELRSYIKNKKAKSK